jgi:hypothetical protein
MVDGEHHLTHFFISVFLSLSSQEHTPQAVATVKLPFKQRLSDTALSLPPFSTESLRFDSDSDCDSDSDFTVERENFLHTFVTKEFVHPPRCFRGL